MIVDIIVIIGALIAGVLGAKKGFIYVICKLAGFILALVLAFSFYKPLANYLYNNYDFGNKINNSIEEAISSSQADNQKDEENTEYNSVNKLLEKFRLSDKLDLNDVKDEVTEERSLTDVASEKITNYIMNIIAFLIIFVGVILITAIVSVILSAIFSIPLLKEINKFGGFIIEIILFAIKLCIIFKIISILAPMEFMSGIMAIINKSVIVKFLYENNILIYVMSKIKISI